jgi:hypothetical protein
MPGLGLLDCVNRKGADGVDTQLIDFRICQKLSNLGRTHRLLLTSDNRDNLTLSSIQASLHLAFGTLSQWEPMLGGEAFFTMFCAR